MGERTSHAPGTFSWVDLGTTDAQAAKAFYGRLFGWQGEDMPAGEGMTYTMLRRDGKDVAALYELSDEMRSQGVPPHWACYITVGDADAAARRAGELGGTVAMEPFDVLDAGRMALVQDPQGAMFSVWQPARHIGAQLVNGVGALSWNDLVTPDPETAAGFYRDMFGWTTQAMEGAEPSYLVIRNGERANGGIFGTPPGMEGVPPYWTAYFGIADLDAGLGEVEQAGGSALTPAMEVPAGRFAAVQDPQGAAFSLVEGKFDD
jgi:uncharacterized protein